MIGASDHIAMRYRAYGVALETDVPMPELEAVEGSSDAADVFTFATRASEPPTPRESIVYADTKDDDDPFTCARCDAGYVMTFSSTWRFFVGEQGRSMIAYDPLPAPETLRHLVLDNVLPYALNVAGRDSLHATAVLTPRGVVAFMGPSGAGKSTLAARCVSRGLALVSDDCLVLSIEDDGGGIRATPSYSGLRLLPDGVAWMGHELRATTPVAEYGTKRRIAGEHTATTRGGPLVAIYVLPTNEPLDPATPSERATHVTIEPLAKRDAFSRILEGSFRLDIDDRKMVKRQFELFTVVAKRVPVKLLRIPRALSAVDDAFAAIRADLGF